ncbi:Crp/Fnr family transcriptional regulator [Chloroflexi bacterium TSY]|nr:Crp/Fnr family transcriptional regulator [Chloroflexi bacterium TSY]
MAESSFNSIKSQDHTSTLDTLFALRNEDRRFSENVHMSVFKQGAVVASSEELAENLYILVSGVANLVCLNAKGRRMVVSTLESGAIFGEGLADIHLNPEGDFHLFAEAAKNVKVWTIPAPQARNMAMQYPILSWGMLQTYGERLLQVEDGLEEVAHKTLPQRLAGLLLDFSERENTLLLKKISHQLLADHIGTYRETVSAILRDFKSQGLLELGYRRIKILDVESLEDFAGI